MNEQAQREQQLLDIIHQGLDEPTQTRLDTLMEKRDASPFEEVLTPAEHAELDELLDRVELYQLGRMEALIELAEMRDVAVTTLMFELEILTEEKDDKRKG